MFMWQRFGAKGTLRSFLVGLWAWHWNSKYFIKAGVRNYLGSSKFYLANCKCSQNIFYDNENNNLYSPVALLNYLVVGSQIVQNKSFFNIYVCVLVHKASIKADKIIFFGPEQIEKLKFLHLNIFFFCLCLFSMRCRKQHENCIWDVLLDFVTVLNSMVVSRQVCVKFQREHLRLCQILNTWALLETFTVLTLSLTNFVCSLRIRGLLTTAFVSINLSDRITDQLISACGFGDVERSCEVSKSCLYFDVNAFAVFVPYAQNPPWSAAVCLPRHSIIIEQLSCELAKCLRRANRGGEMSYCLHEAGWKLARGDLAAGGWPNTRGGAKLCLIVLSVYVPSFEGILYLHASVKTVSVMQNQKLEWIS